MTVDDLPWEVRFPGWCPFGQNVEWRYVHTISKFRPDSHMFCTVCPDLDKIPAECTGQCVPGCNPKKCGLSPCPCFAPATPERWAAYEKWLADNEAKERAWQEHDAPVKIKREDRRNIVIPKTIARGKVW